MVEAPCGSCGQVLRLADADVPPSGKVTRCPSCGGSITVMPPNATAMGMNAASLPPVPERASPLAGLNLPPARPVASPLDGLTDLPAPVGPSPSGGGPHGRAGFEDLPAPVGPAPTRGMPGIPDLPAPVGSRAPKTPPPIPGSAHPDLPAPVGPSATRGAPGIPNLPVPVGPASARGIPNLPSPVGPNSRGGADLLTPVGPNPRGGGLDLPAPKGFFDDVPGPVSQSSQRGSTDLPAPKGFFDDVPAPVTPGTPGKSGLPAPKGFFDDQPPPSVGSSRSDQLAPKGFFDDERIPGVPSSGMDLELGASGAGHSPLDLGDALDLGDPLELGGSAGASRPFGLDSLDVDLSSGSHAAPSVNLELPDVGASGDPFGGLELPDVGSGDDGPAGVVSFNRPTAEAKQRAAQELEVPSTPAHRKPFGMSDHGAESLELDTADAGALRQVGKTVAKAPPTVAEKMRSRRATRKRTMLLAGVLLVVGGGAGGFYLFTNYQESQAKADKVQAHLAAATQHLAGDAPGHWDQASTEATAAASQDSKNAVARALIAQAQYGALLDEGRDAQQRRQRGRKAVTDMRALTAKGVEIDKALGLQALVERRIPEAIQTFKTAATKAADDANLHLYLGWAYSSAYQYGPAIQSFGKANQQNPNRIAALYGLGQAQLAMGLVTEAREAFLKVSQISRDKYKHDHIGALVGIAQLSEEEGFGDRENRYLEITQREGLERADPRAVSQAYSLAGDEALRAGRVDAASKRYTTALERDPHNLHALVGGARVSLRRDQLDAARVSIEQVTAIEPGNVPAVLTLAEIALAEDNIEEAQTLVTQVLERQPPVAAEAEMRAHMVLGAIYSQDTSQAAAAESEYRKAAELASESEIAPAIALSKLLAKQGRGDDALKELQPIRKAAEQDPALAVILGVAYLETGDSAVAEDAFRAALTKRPGDVEATFQLGLALYAQEKYAESLLQIKTAYETNEAREDIGVRLAQMYEDLQRDSEAGELYKRLLGIKTPGLDVLAAAGLFYARTGNVAQAGALGEMIRDKAPRHAAGKFLEGEMNYSEGNFEDARSKYAEAARLEPRAQFLDGVGRASEKLGMFDEAVTNYGKALEADARYLSPRLGRARIQLVRGKFKAALDELDTAKQIAPNDPNIHAGIGKSHLAMRRYKEAVAAYELAVKLDDTNAEWFFELGNSYFDLDKPRPAVVAFRKAIEIGDGEEKWRVKALDRLGRSARMTNQNSTAIKAYKELLERVPPDSLMHREAERELMRLQAR